MELFLIIILILLCWGAIELIGWWLAVLIIAIILTWQINEHRKKKICTPVLFALSFVAVTLLAYTVVGGTMLYERYQEEQEQQQREERDKAWREQRAERLRQDSIKKANEVVPKSQPAKSSSRGASHSSTVVSSSYHYSSDDESVYSDGYESGYEDGLHRDHGARQKSDAGDYGDGYSQGYYDAVQEDRDYFDDDDDEEEGW